MILLKDNHVDFAGGIENAISRCHDYLKAKGKDLKIEIEVRNLDELKEVMRVGGVDRIMLDNFSPELTKEAVKIVGGKYEIESSGGITFDTIRDYAESGNAHKKLRFPACNRRCKFRSKASHYPRLLRLYVSYKVEG